MPKSESKVLTIYRDEWYRGRDGASLRVPNETGIPAANIGKMCCLGFDALACGFTVTDIEDKSDPCDLAIEYGVDELPSWYVEARLVVVDEEGNVTCKNNHIINECIEVNDDKFLTESQREDKLVPLLKQLGWEDVVFKDSRKEELCALSPS